MIPQLPLGSLPSGYSEPLAAQTLSLPDHVTQHHRTILFAFVLLDPELNRRPHIYYENILPHFETRVPKLSWLLLNSLSSQLSLELVIFLPQLPVCL